MLEQTGLRVSEPAALEWGDVDVASDRLRVRRGKTRSARRWVQLPPWLTPLLEATCPLDDRVPARRVVQGVEPQPVAGGDEASLHRRGHGELHVPRPSAQAHLALARAEIPARELAERAGHSKPSVSFDVYSHLLPSGEAPMESLLAFVAR